VLKKRSAWKGDRVAIYMPMMPELVIAMLACARIGAVHSGGVRRLLAESLADRINDAQCKVLITADGGWRRGSIVPLKRTSTKRSPRRRPSKCASSSARRRRISCACT
jgi:acetyl-CoA synthetase